RLNGRYGRGRIVDHLLGKTKDAGDFERGLSTFGIGTDRGLAEWRDLLDQLLFEGLLREDPNDGRPLITLGDADAVRAVYRGERRVGLRKQPEKEARAPRQRRGAGEPLMALSADELPLFERLRVWRRDEA